MTTQTPIDPRFTQAHQKGPHVEVFWKAVTYKTVIGYGLLALAIIAAGLYVVKPDLYQALFKKFEKAVHLLVDLGSLEERPSNTLPGLVDELLRLLPGLEEHSCSTGRKGGFVERLREGTYMAHIAEHIALELQCLAGTEVGFGRARSVDKPGHYRVVVSRGPGMEKPVGERLSKTVLPNTTRTVPQADPFQTAAGARLRCLPKF